jgi:outer membrane lipoprotein-sorting protein
MRSAKKAVWKQVALAALTTAVTWVGWADEPKPPSRLIADFTIERTLAALSDKITSTGRLYMGGPGLLKWETISPSKSTLVINGQEAWVSYPDLGVTKSFEVQSDPVMRVLTEHLLALTSGNLNRIVSLYDVTDLKGGAKKLVPKESSVKMIFSEIRVTFGANGAVSRVEMVSQSGDITAISFQNVRLNQPFPADAFQKPKI